MPELLKECWLLFRSAVGSGFVVVVEFGLVAVEFGLAVAVEFGLWTVPGE